MRNFDVNVFTRSKVFQAEDGDLVGSRNLVIVCGVLEPERKQPLVGMSMTFSAVTDSGSPLLLQVGLVDTDQDMSLLSEVQRLTSSPSKGSADDRSSTQESWFQSSVFSRRPLSVVLITNDDPWDSGISVAPLQTSALFPRCSNSSSRCDIWDSAVLSSLLVEDLVGLTVVGVDSPNEHVLCSCVSATSLFNAVEQMHGKCFPDDLGT